MRCCVARSFSEALPDGERCTAASPSSTYGQDRRKTALNNTNLDVAKIKRLELPDLSERIATVTAADDIQSFTGTVEQILISCKGVNT